MALAIDGSTPAVATQASATVATVATASFTPPAGSLLLVLYSANTVDPTSPATPTITDSLGGHLTYTLSDFSARADTPAADGQAAIWTAPVVTSAAMTVTVTNQAPSGSRHAALAVIVITGAATSPVGAHGKSGSISAASIAQNYTAQATGGWGFISVIDWSAKGAMSAGTGCTLIGSANLGAPDITYGFVRRTTADDSNGVSNTLNVTLGGTSTSLRWAYIEIKPDASIPYAAPRYPVVRDYGEAPWIQKDRRNANLVATAANPLVAPLDSAWQASARFWHLYNDRTRTGWQPQQRAAFDPTLLTPVLAGIPYVPPRTVQTRDPAPTAQRRAVMLLDAPPTAAIAFDTTGSTSVLAGTTSATVDITAAAVGAWCYCWASLGLNSGAVASGGWVSLLDSDEGVAAHYALLRRQKQPGDTTFSFTWTNSTKATFAWASWTGLDSVTPDEQAALATNGVTGRTAVPSPSATPTAGNRWAVAFFGVRTSTAGNKPITWTPDGATTERIDVDNNAAAGSPWSGVEIADTNTTVTQTAHSYTATHNASESHDGSAILFLIPGAAAESVPFTAQRTVQIRDFGDVQWLQRRVTNQLTDALIENELLGQATTAQRVHTPATNALRWWMPQQPKHDATTPGLLDTAQLEVPLLGVDRHGTWYTERRVQPPQRGPLAPADAPIVIDPLTVAWGAGGNLWHLYNTAADQASRAWWPKQREYRSDPSFYPTVAPTDPLTLAYGAGGTYWLLYNVAAVTVDRREVPQQRQYTSDPLLLTTALLEIPPGRTQSPTTDRRYPPLQLHVLSMPDVATPDIPLGDQRARLTATTHTERRGLLVQPPRRTLYFDAGPDLPPLTLTWGAGGDYWHRYNDWRRPRTWWPAAAGLVLVSGDLCSTPRPSSGTTTRPGSGITTYALATTARPGSGITVRPDTGVTEDPC